MRRIKVLDEHKRHIAVCRQRRKHDLTGLEPPGRGTNANDKEILGSAWRTSRRSLY
jgi:hypothetical protein